MKKMRYIIFSTLLLLSSLVTAQQELQLYLQTAAKNNHELKAKFNAYLAELEKGPQAKSLPDPQIAFAYFISPVETRVGPQQFKISASQMFPWFGTLKSSENIYIESAKAKYQAFEEAKSKLFHEVKIYYFDIYFNKKAITKKRENLDILKSFRKLSNIKIESGLTSAVDAYRIEMEINEMERSIALLEDQNNVLTTSFNNLISVENNSEVIIPEELWDEEILLSKTEVLDSIRIHNHQLMNIEFQQKSLAFKKEFASKQGNPSIKVGLDYTFIGKGNNNLSGKDAFVFPSIGLTLPLYRKKYNAMINEAVLMETAKNEERLNKENILESVFENAWKDYTDAKRRIYLYGEQLELANASMNILETEYATANRNFEELLRMDRKLLKYQLELEKAKVDKQAAISLITYLMGK